MQHADPVTPESIDTGFAPRRAEVAAETVVGDDILVATRPFRPCHRLNSSAAYLWERLDGVTPLAEIAAGIAGTTGVDESVIADDAVGFARHLGRMGLLEGVASPPPTDAEPVELPVPGVGGELDDFELPDADGRDVSWAELRGRRVLLVNWSPYCTFCVQIAERLGELRPHLERQAVELVLVTSGDIDTNRGLLEGAGLTGATTLYRRDGVDPFAGLGTPAALCFDEAGRVTEPLAYGALDTPELAARLAGLDTEEDEDPPAARYLPGGGGACAPGAVGVKSKGSQWAGLAVYGFGEHHVGVRFDSADTEALLERLFPGARVEDRRARADFSVALQHPGKRSANLRFLDLLVRDDLQVVRSRSAGRVLRALVGYLSVELYNPDPGLLQVDGIAVVRDGRAHVLPSLLYRMFSLAQPRLGRLGLQIVDRPRVSLDPATAEVVVAGPTVAHDPAVLDELDAAEAPVDEAPPIAPGRYPLGAWVLVDDDRPDGPLPTAAAAAMGMGLVTWVPSLQGVLDDLVATFERAHGYSLRYIGVDDFLGRLPAAINQRA